MANTLQQFLESAAPDDILNEYLQLHKKGLACTEEERQLRAYLRVFITSTITEGRRAGINSLPYSFTGKMQVADTGVFATCENDCRVSAHTAGCKAARGVSNA